ncbi:MAG: ribonuclease R [Chromatiales bacterium]|nr:MAG: ribonuclease R [Chromatiales bacterium]
MPPAEYRHPLPARARLLEVLADAGVPLSLARFAELLDLKGDRQRAALRKRLQRMAASGQLLINRRGEYCQLDKLGVVVGRVSAHPDGFGFLLPEGEGEDVYLSFQQMRALLDGDRVAVRVTDGVRRGKRSGTVVEIIERGKEAVVGRYERRHGIGYVLESGRSPHQFLVPDHQRGGARDGQMVKLQITEYPGTLTDAQGRVVAVLGEAGDPGMATAVAIEQFGLPHEWPAQVAAAADAWGPRVRPADKSGREDLRELPLVTIDGADARDFDDAVYAEPAGDGWRLVVAIADVSHYVQPAKPLDKEARLRGTSVYFPDRVVPMLPEGLSNGLCSLNPKVDRLCMVCDMRIGQQGKVSRSRFYRGVMRSAARLTYHQVDEFQRTGTGPKNLQSLGPQIAHLYDVFRALAAARRRRGALDLDLPEVKIELDAQGQVERVLPRPRNDAHRLIEVCMIAANVEAAKFLRRHRLATLYRVHEGPGEQKFEELRVMLQELGIAVPDQARKEPRHLNRALQQIAARPDADQLTVAVLRSLSQAVYQPANLGHFGLALGCYAHFTSPIRRYPDLVVHRGIGHVLDGGKPGSFLYDLPAMEQAGTRCSEQERRADDAARQVESQLKAAYLQQHIGDVLPGTVTGVTHFGLFVTLDGLYVDGLVHVTALGNDYFQLTDGGLRLTGDNTGRSYGLGDAVSVRVARVDTDEAKVDLVLAEDVEPRQRRRTRRGPGRRRRG